MCLENSNNSRRTEETVTELIPAIIQMNYSWVWKLSIKILYSVVYLLIFVYVSLTYLSQQPYFLKKGSRPMSHAEKGLHVLIFFLIYHNGLYSLFIYDFLMILNFAGNVQENVGVNFNKS